MHSNKRRLLTGITTTGVPHLGNYVGAIRPAILSSKKEDVESFLFLADYHGLIKCHDSDVLHQSTLAIAATLLACGVDVERTTFYRQSDIAEIMELNWILSCITPKGLINRAHGYKAAVDANLANHLEEDHQIEMGLFSYPILMSADILLFRVNEVPVGKDQIQHIEIARDIACRFNHRFKDIFVLPEANVGHNELLVGLDGRKMSKSYRNTIAIMDDDKKTLKAINKIVTNSKEPGEPKFRDESAIFDIFKAFSSPEEYAEFESKLADGLSWGEAKKLLAAKVSAELAESRERYKELITNVGLIEEILQSGATKARKEARLMIEEVRDAVGIKRLR